MPITINNPDNRMLELDVFRGLAAVCVLLFHYTTFYAVKYPHQGEPLFYFPWLPFRIQLFAMISGFVIMMILERTKTPLDFVIARFSRLYPCYFFSVVFVSLLCLKFPSLGTRVTIYWPKFFVHLAMLESWSRYYNIDAVYWYLAPEITFYCIVLVFFMAKKTGSIEKFGLWGLVLVVINARYGHIGPLEIPAVVVASRILGFWQYFLAGILFYNLKFKGDTWWRHAGIAACFVVQNFITDDFYNVLCMGGDLLLFYSFIYGKLSWIVRRPLVFLGTISYSLYLIHLTMGQMIIKFLYMLQFDQWTRLIIPTAVSILMATMMTYGIERPAMKYIRSQYARWKK